jgi:5-methylcytosine-specific restriction endonuclease McrA
MARLKAMPTRVMAVPLTVMPMVSGDYEADRAKWSQSRKWYQSKRWRLEVRPSELIKAGFTCLWCRLCDPTGRALVVDHKIPHRGDEDLFWAESNRQVLCTTCHNGRKQRQEQRGGVSI